MVAAVVLVAAAVGGFLLLGGDDDDPDDLATGDSTTTTAEESTSTTTPPLVGGAEFAGVDPSLPAFVDIDSVDVLEDGTLSIAFEPVGFALDDPSFDGPEHHVHLFYGNQNRPQAGNNGDPVQCGCWLAFGGGSPVEEAFFTLDTAAGQTEICALVATPNTHEIADVTGDGEPDPGSGDCIDITAIADGSTDRVEETSAES